MRQILTVLNQRDARTWLAGKRGELTGAHGLTRFSDGLLYGAEEVLEGRQ